jgi:hypothetical protein
VCSATRHRPSWPQKLGAEGAVSLYFNSSHTEVVDNLAPASRDWEEVFTSQPLRRRRVKLDADAEAAAQQPWSNRREQPSRLT